MDQDVLTFHKHVKSKNNKLINNCSEGPENWTPVTFGFSKLFTSCTGRLAPKNNQILKTHTQLQYNGTVRNHIRSFGPER